MWCGDPHAHFALHGPRHTFILARSVSYRPPSREHVYKVQLSFAKATSVPSLLEETRCMTYSQIVGHILAIALPSQTRYAALSLAR